MTLLTFISYKNSNHSPLFKDHFRIGGVMNIIATVATAAALYVVYYI